MKKLATLLLAAGMVVASSAPASAADVKLDGFYRYTFHTASTGFQGKNVEANQWRMRLGLSIVASENLSGYTQFQIGTNDFGTAPKHGKRDDIQTRQMYVDWKVPATPVKVRMGRSQFGLPADAFGGNMVFGAAWGPNDGIVLNAPVADWLDMNAFWARASFSANEDGDIHFSDHADMFGLAANLKFNGLTVAPWVAYSTIDAADPVVKDGEVTNAYITRMNNSSSMGEADLAGAASDSYYFGATATLTAFDPFKLVVSAAYGNRDYEGKWQDREGWAAQAKATYKLGFGTPVVAAWYASGDAADDETGAGMLPGINPYSSPTGTFFDGGTGLTLGVDRFQHLGTWGAQVGIEDVSFVSGLTHAATVTWIQGTNNTKKADSDDTDAFNYMTTSDSVVELALTSDYKIYKNLAACLELAYIINNFDEDLYNDNVNEEDDWRVTLTMTYKF